MWCEAHCRMLLNVKGFEQNILQGEDHRGKILGVDQKYWGWIKGMGKMRQSDCYDHKRRTHKSLPTRGTRAHEYYECVWYLG